MNNGFDAQSPDRPLHAPPATGMDEGTTLLRTLLVLQRRGWILAVIWGFCLALAAVFAFGRPRSYRSEATLEVRPDRPVVSLEGGGDPLVGNTQLWENHFRTQESLLRRPGLLARVLEELPPETVEPYRKAPDPVRLLSQHVEIDTIPSTFLIRIALDHPVPDKGPEIVNKLVSLYIEEAHRRLRELKSGALEILNTEALPVIRQKVDESEQLLQSFQARMGFGDLEEQYAALLESKRKLEARSFDVLLRRVALQCEAETPVAGTEEDSTALPRPSPEGARILESLVTRRTELELELVRQSGVLKERHPTLIALRQQLEKVRDRIRGTAEAAIASRDRELAAVALEGKALAREGKALDQRISEARVRLAQYKKLEAEVAAARELYNSFLKKQGEVNATSGAGLASVRVVELAGVSKAHHRKPLLYLTLGAVLGLFLGVAGILVAEQVDDRIATPRQAEAALGLDLLTVVPLMAVPTESKGRPLVPEDASVSSPLEPFRRLRTEVVTRLQGSPGSKVVAVLSPQYSEGRSTVAINLARVLALEGLRVLLFDADLRRPRLKALLANEHAAGLEEYLRGEVPLARCVQECRVRGVRLIGAEWELGGPAEIPGSPRFRPVWQAVRSEYDFIIVDTSPVNAVSEVAVIAGSADASLLVVEERRTGIQDALAAKRRLMNHGVRLLGLVVNGSHAPLPRRRRPDDTEVNLDRVDLENSTFVEIE